VNPVIEFIKKEIYRFMSIWVQTILGPVSTAILYQLIFGRHFSQVSTGIPGVSYAQFIIPGLIMMQILLNAFGNGSASILQAKYNGSLIFILMAPISPLNIYLGYLVSSIIRGVMVGLAVWLGICWFGITLPHNYWILIYFTLLGSMIAAGTGVVVGTLTTKFDQLAGFQSFVLVPLTYLSGVFFNPFQFTGFWHKVALLDPFLYIVDGFRYAFFTHQSANIWVGIIFVLVLALIINIVGYTLLRLGIKIKH
jgi:ABC-2 type transport system permease protein